MSLSELGSTRSHLVSSVSPSRRGKERRIFQKRLGFALLATRTRPLPPRRCSDGDAGDVRRSTAGDAPRGRSLTEMAKRARWAWRRMSQQPVSRQFRIEASFPAPIHRAPTSAGGRCNNAEQRAAADAGPSTEPESPDVRDEATQPMETVRCLMSVNASRTDWSRGEEGNGWKGGYACGRSVLPSHPFSSCYCKRGQ